jgi:hypothetical protein
MPKELSDAKSRENVDAFLRKALVVLPIIVVFAMVCFGLYWMSHKVTPNLIATSPAAPSAAGVPTQTPNPSVSLGWWDGLPQSVQPGVGLLVGAIGVLVVIALLKYISKGSGTGAFKAGSFTLQVITSLAVAALLFAVLYPLNPTAPLFMTDEGHYHIAMYAVMIIVAVMVATNLKGFGKLSAAAIIVVVFGLLGPRTLMLYDPDGLVRAKLHLTGLRGAATQVASAPPQALVMSCTGVKKEWVFGAQPQPINPEASCAPDLWFEGHCIYVQRARWTNDHTVYRNCGGKLPNDVEFAWSADETFVGAVALSQPRYNY